MTNIAARAKNTRVAVHHYTVGKRGRNFPPPVESDDGTIKDYVLQFFTPLKHGALKGSCQAQRSML